MPQLARDDCVLQYDVAGDGPVVFLSHAFGATSQMWNAQVEALRSTHRVITWDMRGHGSTISPGDPQAYSEAAALSDMLALLHHVAVEKATFGGLSLGGYLSLSFARSFPERVRALMLFDTGPGFRNANTRQRWNAMAEERALALEARGLAALGPQHPNIGHHTSAAALAHAARGILTKHDAHVIDSLERVTVPALVVVGEHDTQLAAAADLLAAQINGARKVVIPGAGHFSNLDQPEAFNAVMLQFLREL